MQGRRAINGRTSLLTSLARTLTQHHHFSYSFPPLFSPSLRYFGAEPQQEQPNTEEDFNSDSYPSFTTNPPSTHEPRWNKQYRAKVNKAIFGKNPPKQELGIDEEERRKRANRLAKALLQAALTRPDDEEEAEAGDGAVKEEDQRSLSVGIIGAPNAGKSALTNFMVGTKVAAVSRKTNTTTHEVLGVLTKGNTQICFFDTPGLMLKRSGRPYRTDVTVRVESAWSSLDLYDLLIVIFDVHRHLTAEISKDMFCDDIFGESPAGVRKSAKGDGLHVERSGLHDNWDDAEGYYSYRIGVVLDGRYEVTAAMKQLILRRDGLTHSSRKADWIDGYPIDPFKQTMPDIRVIRLIKHLGIEVSAKGKRVLCMNKVDLVEEKKDLLKVAKEFDDLPGYERYFMISGLKGSGVKDLVQYLMDQAVKRPWDEDPTNLTEDMMKTISLEVVREKMLDYLHQEIPYTLEHRLIDWKELRDGSLRIEQHLITRKQGQRKIIIGKNGSKIGRIGFEANEELRSIFKRNVHLILQVRVVT